MKWLPKTLHGVKVWITDEAAATRDFPIAPDEHITDGQLNDQCFKTPSYAHHWPGVGIVKHLAPIGQFEDLKPWEPNAS
jgi:hypothetical protein